jgi:ATP-dependent DNA helicase PIF1
MALSEDQANACEAFEGGDNLFITGPGGTGKSHLIRLFCSNGQKEDVQVCAMTGTAAMLLECKATTLHSWAGIGAGNGELVERVMGNFVAKKRWRAVKVLILDEVSMLSQELFEKLDEIAKTVRRNTRPFGGIQVVFCGDFCQLPPVSDDGRSKYCFESPLWEKTFKRQLVLTTIHRQKDASFCKVLHQIRLGRITKSSYDLLMSRVLRDGCEPEFPATRIVPTRDKADRINRTEYAKLEGAEHTFTANVTDRHDMTPSKARERARYSAQTVAYEKDNFAARRMPSVVQLKVGTHVMCTHNVDENLCNGSQGVVVSFSFGFPVVRLGRGSELRTISPVTVESDRVPGVAVTQMPLIYAWAITIHKAQGATLDTAIVDVGTGIFEAGQTYTALSRLSSMDYLYLTSFDPSKIKTDPAVISFYGKLQEKKLSEIKIAPRE